MRETARITRNHVRFQADLKAQRSGGYAPVATSSGWVEQARRLATTTADGRASSASTVTAAIAGVVRSARVAAVHGVVDLARRGWEAVHIRLDERRAKLWHRTRHRRVRGDRVAAGVMIRAHGWQWRGHHWD